MLIEKMKVVMIMNHKDFAPNKFLLQIQDRIFFFSFLSPQLDNMLHIDQYQYQIDTLFFRNISSYFSYNN